MTNRTPQGDKAEQLLKEAILAIKDLEVELTRKGSLPGDSRGYLNNACADIGMLIVGYDMTNLIWLVRMGEEYAEKNRQAVVDGIASLTAEEAEAFAKYVAENERPQDQ
jgi:hypothetical protein